MDEIHKRFLWFAQKGHPTTQTFTLSRSQGAASHFRFTYNMTIRLVTCVYFTFAVARDDDDFDHVQAAATTQLGCIRYRIVVLLDVF